MINQTVGELMTTPARTVTPEETARGLAKLFTEHGIGSAVVVDPETGTPLGIVTESDVMQQVANDADLDTSAVESFYSAPIITVASTESIHTAATLMKAHSIQRLPVVDGGKLEGMLTTSDLANYLPRIRNTILRNRRYADRR